MDIKHLLCPIIVCSMLLLSADSQDVETCPKDGMIFHPETHTCFLFSQMTLEVNQAKDKCLSYKGGPLKDIPGHLVRITDSETNELLKGVVLAESLVALEKKRDQQRWTGLEPGPLDNQSTIRSTLEPINVVSVAYTPSSKKRYWIGLNDVDEMGNYKWDSLKSDQPGFLDWAEDEPQEDASKRYVVLGRQGWYKAGGQDIQMSYICQIPAVIPPVHLTASLAYREGGRATNIKCIFSPRSWTQVEWKNTVVGTLATCEQKSNDELKCISTAVGYSAFIQTRRDGSIVIRLGIETVRREDEGVWTCVVKYHEENVGQNSQMLQVYFPAEKVTCESTESPFGFEILCQTLKNYPNASCEWQIHSDTQVDILERNNVTVGFQNMPYPAARAHKYFASECFLSLHKDSFQFQLGMLNITVSFLAGFNLGDRKTSINLGEKMKSISIEKPRTPRFKQNGLVIDSVVHAVAGKMISLVCNVYHGHPKVETTTMICDFPITRHGANNETWNGVSTVFRGNVTVSMDGKQCSCYGQHVTGRTETKTVIFNITTDNDVDCNSNSGCNNRNSTVTNSGGSYSTTEGYRETSERQDVTTHEYDPTTHEEDLIVGSTAPRCNRTGEECNSTIDEGGKDKGEVLGAQNEQVKDSAGGGYLWLGVGAAVVVAFVLQMLVLALVLRKMKFNPSTSPRPKSSCSYTVNP